MIRLKEIVSSNFHFTDMSQTIVLKCKVLGNKGDRNKLLHSSCQRRINLSPSINVVFREFERAKQ